MMASSTSKTASRKSYPMNIHASTRNDFEFADAGVLASFLSVFVLRALNLGSRSVFSDSLPASVRNPHKGSTPKPTLLRQHRRPDEEAGLPFCHGQTKLSISKAQSGNSCVGPAPAGGNHPETAYLGMQPPLLTKLMR